MCNQSILKLSELVFTGVRYEETFTEISLGIIHLVHTQNFRKKLTFLTP